MAAELLYWDLKCRDKWANWFFMYTNFTRSNLTKKNSWFSLLVQRDPLTFKDFTHCAFMAQGQPLTALKAFSLSFLSLSLSKLVTLLKLKHFFLLCKPNLESSLWATAVKRSVSLWVLLDSILHCFSNSITCVFFLWLDRFWLNIPGLLSETSRKMDYKLTSKHKLTICKMGARMFLSQGTVNKWVKCVNQMTYHLEYCKGSNNRISCFLLLLFLLGPLA